MAALDENISGRLSGTAIAFIVLEILFVALRFVARYVGDTRLALDDYLMVLALISNLGLCGVSLAFVYAGGAGRHLAWHLENDPEVVVTYSILSIPFMLMVPFSITFAKLSILFLYLRISREKIYRTITYTVMVIQILVLVQGILLTFLICTPLAYFWEHARYPGGHCIDMNSFWRWGSFPNIPTDLAMLILPIPTLWKLRLSKKEKIGVIVTLATGSIGLISSIIRFVLFYGTDGRTDQTFSAVKLGCVSIAECGVYLISGCLPVYRSFFNVIRRRNAKATHNSENKWKSHEIELTDGARKQSKASASETRRWGVFKQMGNEEWKVNIGRADSQKSLVAGIGDGNGDLVRLADGTIKITHDYSATVVDD